MSKGEGERRHNRDRGKEIIINIEKDNKKETGKPRKQKDGKIGRKTERNKERKKERRKGRKKQKMIET